MQTSSLGPTGLGYHLVPARLAGVMEQLQYALKTGLAPLLSAADNLKTMAILEAAYRWVREGRAVPLAEFGF
jgi:predicted dehydrogenase